MKIESGVIRPHFVQEVRELLQQARQKAYRAVHFIMVETYWQVGRRIVEEEQQGKERADYGAFLIRELSRSLSDEFGKGFALANLKNFRQFYLTFPDFEKSYALRSQLTWSHYRLIMRLDKPQARDFYIRESADQQWSTRQLERNIQTHYYERLLSTPGEQLPAETERIRPTDFVKDPYVLEFLNLPETDWGTEKTLESALIENLQHFLLKCFVLLDLKTGKLSPQDVGRMDMYVRMFDDLKRQPDDNPSVGIILCESKDETVARYSVLHGSEQLFASKYRLVLPSEEELAAELSRERKWLTQKTENSDAGKIKGGER